ncbi:MAG TPA: PD-(D/E)XK nuclease family protein [Solirubrobacteraceae bacterium]|nr:PD-(D/E)XK nuclease family protein [Solirubrobacteraceae bacterium]
MPLTLVTGPANAEKARVVLDRLRAALDRDPILVVPTVPDMERYRRELADDGLVFGARVETFDGLLREVAHRVGPFRAPLGRLARERVAVAAAEAVDSPALRASAATPGFAPAACRLFDELEEERVTPQRWIAALRTWADGDEQRRGYAEDLGRLYAAYRDRLARLDRLDETLHQAAALDALLEARGAWGATPVLFYGFDDLRPLQLDAIRALSATDADVTVSLTYEPGRHAFAARGAAMAELGPLADHHVPLDPRAEHYAEESRAALHHLERRLFEESAPWPAAEPAAAGGSPPPGSAPGEQGLLFADPTEEIVVRRGPLLERGADGEGGGGVSAGDAVVFLEGGGERAELELVASEAGRLIADGVPPDEIALVLRRPDETAALVEQVFAAYGVPVAVTRRVAFGHSPLGRGLLALLRAATGGTAADLILWLRTPGLVRASGRVDRLEAEVRRTGARSAAQARAIWDERHEDFPLEALDRVARASAEGPKALLDRLGAELASLFAAPHRRQARVLDAAEASEAQVLREGRKALDDLAVLADVDASLLPGPQRLAELLGGVTVRLGERAAPGAVQVSDPLSLRARRVRVLFLARLQEGVFPAPARPEPFLGDDERREINAASGLRLRAHEDAIGAERYLLYATVSRPERQLLLSWHAADDEGDPAVRSSFVDDVALLFADEPLKRARTRDLGAVGSAAPAASERERRRAEAHTAPRVREPVAQPLRSDDVLQTLRAQPAWSASALETYAGCPVKWFVERLLNPEGLEPDPEAMVRGNLAHKVLEQALSRLVDGGGLTPARLPEARDAVRSALDDLEGELPMSVDPSRRRAMRRRLEADLLRYVDAAAASRSQFVPRDFEQEFEGLDAGDGIVLRGKVDRIDVRPGTNEAILYDYKGKSAYGAAKWIEERRFQLAVYALAARRLLGLEPVGALYQPLGAERLTPRGALVADADPDLVVGRDDRLTREAFEALVQEAIAAAVDAAGRARSGALRPQPETCAWGGGCQYPTICRCEG